MINKLLLPGIFLLLSYGFWVSPDFKTIVAGIAIFLFGMLSLQQGFKTFTGGVLEKILHSITDRLWKRLSFGIISTMLMQSSSLVSVLTISFLSAGLLDLAAGMGIVFGANLGTTTGAWLVAGFGVKVNIAAYAMPMLVFGVLLILQKSNHLKGVGYILTGVGFLFLGIHYMKEGFETFRETIILTEYAVPGVKGLVIYVLLGLAVTVIIQSSDATMVLVITALATHQITYENALAMAIGTNIGTTITAIIGSLSANVQGKRLAAAHFLFNLVTGLIALFSINQFVWIVDRLSEFVGIASDDFTLKLAAFHSLFNLVGISIMLPLTGAIADRLQKTFKEKPVMVDQPRYLNKVAILYPDTMVEAVRQETEHLFDNACHIILKTLGMKRHVVFSQQDLKIIVEKAGKIPDYNIDSAYERNIKGIYSAIVEFISQATIAWEFNQSGILYQLREANRNLVEAIKGSKHFQKNLRRVSISGNQSLVEQYNKFRFELAMLLRELNTYRQEYKETELGILSLDNLKAAIKEQDQRLNHEIDFLIRESKITPEAGTSLMNDSAYVYDIKKNLLKMAGTVFVIRDPEVTEAERKLSLDDTELLEVINPDHSNKSTGG